MKLNSLIIKNFRGYRDIEIPFNENLNLIIGRNDVGKSTILDALEIFFNNDKVKMEVSDLNIDAIKEGETEITIGATFILEGNETVVIDSTAETNLKDEFLLNKNGLLEIHRTYSAGGKSITASGVKNWIIAHHPINFIEKPLISLKLKDLVKLYEKDYEEINDGEKPLKNSKPPIRKAIYRIANIGEFDTASLLIDKIGEDSKSSKETWDSIEKYLPIYNLFQVDRPNRDSDKDVQDPLKAITKSVIDEIKGDLEPIKKKIEDAIEKLGEATIEKLKETNEEIATGLKSVVENRPWESLFNFQLEDERGIALNKRGSGVRRLILLSYFQAEAERKRSSTRQMIYAIEEPETAQHPDFQLKILNTLKSISAKENSKVIITTHTPEFAKTVDSKQICYLEKIGHNPTLISDEDIKIKKVIDTLGILPYFGKLVLCVEGEFDREFFLNLSNNEDFRNIICFNTENIKIIPQGGSNLERAAERNYLDNSNVIEYHLYDKDTDGKYQESIDKVKQRKNHSDGCLTNFRELENYIHPSLYETHFEIKFTEAEIGNWSEIDVPNIVTQRTAKFGIPETRNNQNNGFKEAEKRVKSIANKNLVKSMTKDLFEDINAFEEVSDWFKKLRQLNNN